MSYYQSRFNNRVTELLDRSIQHSTMSKQYNTSNVTLGASISHQRDIPQSPSVPDHVSIQPPTPDNKVATPANAPSEVKNSQTQEEATKAIGLQVNQTSTSHYGSVESAHSPYLDTQTNVLNVSVQDQK